MAIRKRIQISASRKAFLDEINRLEKFDALNQSKFASGELNKSQVELLAESLFFAAYRSFEGFFREIFILYCLEKQSSKPPKVKSFLKPKNFEHAEKMIKSSMEYLDWTRTEHIINRAEMYLDHDGHPVKLPITTHQQQLKNFKKIRNHIAHNSIESEYQFVKIVRVYNHGVAPVRIPSAGQFLMFQSKNNPTKYQLGEFFDLMKKLAADLT